MTVTAIAVGFKTAARLALSIGLPWGASSARSAVRKVEAWMPATYPIAESSHRSCRGVPRRQEPEVRDRLRRSH